MSSQMKTYLMYGVLSLVTIATAYYGKQYYDQKPKGNNDDE